MEVAGSPETWYPLTKLYNITSQKTVMLRKVVSLSQKGVISTLTSVRTQIPHYPKLQQLIIDTSCGVSDHFSLSFIPVI
jgi:hypothetical protein